MAAAAISGSRNCGGNPERTKLKGVFMQATRILDVFFDYI
jgi:hypothetical protein